MKILKKLKVMLLTVLWKILDCSGNFLKPLYKLLTLLVLVHLSLPLLKELPV